MGESMRRHNRRSFAVSFDSMRILYLGDNRGTSRHRADTLVRLGHQVHVVDPAHALPESGIVSAWAFKTGGLFLSGIVERQVLKLVANDAYDLVWVNGGDLVGPGLVRALRARFGPVINYNNDDPFGSRDGYRWRLYLDSVPLYDLLVVMRELNVGEARAAGAKKVLRVFMSADEVAHAPRPLSRDDWAKWRSEVAFIGTWLPERGPFLADLARRGVPIAIYGERWSKAPEWPQLKPFWRGPGLHAADDYAKAIQCAKICLGLLSKGNRDLHTQRSLEIPYLGTLLLAERTSEHQALYREDKEAVFWSNAEECAAKCKALLDDDEHRNQIAAAGYERCLAEGHANENVISRILAELPS